MKKYRILTPIFAISTLGGCVAPLSTIISCGKVGVVLTLTIDGGECGKAKTNTITITSGSEWKTVKEQIGQPIDIRNGWIFKEWQIDGKNIQDSYKFIANQTIYATYEYETKGLYCQVSFGTTVGGKLKGLQTRNIKNGTQWSQVELPTYETDEGYNFVSWTIDGIEIQPDYTFRKNVTIIANFEKCTL